MRALLLLVCGCAGAADPCDGMCAAWAEARGACLAQDGLGWEAVGYADQRDAEDACQTWAWEARLLEADAGLDPGLVDALCAARQEDIPVARTEQTCGDLDALDWSAPTP